MQRKIDEIIIGERHRHDLSDIPKLAESISVQGLLQPIGITAENELVFGYRRLLAFRDHLHRDEIDVKIVNVTSIVEGEYAENEMRKDFTVSERLAIMEKIEKEIGNRRGQRTDQLPEDLREVPKGKETKEIAVKRAGLGNTTTARQAGIIFGGDNKPAQGIPELQTAVDCGDIAIEPGFAIALQPPERQAEIITLPAGRRRQAVAELPRPGKHGNGRSGDAKPIKPKREKIDVPYRKMQWPTPEELQRPDFAEDNAGNRAHIERYGRTPLRPIVVADLLKAESATGGLVSAVMAIANEHQLNAKQFFDQIDELLAWVPQKDKTNGEEHDFARDGQKTLSLLRRALPIALDRLTVLAAALVAYDNAEN